MNSFWAFYPNRHQTIDALETARHVRWRPLVDDRCAQLIEITEEGRPLLAPPPTIQSRIIEQTVNCLGGRACNDDHAALIKLSELIDDVDRHAGSVGRIPTNPGQD